MHNMKLAGYFLALILSTIILLLFFGARMTAIIPLTGALILNAGFQVWARHNGHWKFYPNAAAISKRMPIWLYEWVSAVGLLLVVSLAARVFS